MSEITTTLEKLLVAEVELRNALEDFRLKPSMRQTAPIYVDLTKREIKMLIVELAEQLCENFADDKWEIADLVGETARLTKYVSLLTLLEIEELEKPASVVEDEDEDEDEYGDGDEGDEDEDDE